MTGSLQIKNDKYYIVINSIDANGKRKQKWIATGLLTKGNKKKAEKLLRETLREYEKTGNLFNADIQFSDYVKSWLVSIKNQVDVITYQGYETIAKSQIIPYFENKKVKLDKVNVEVLQEYINIKSESGKLNGKGGLSPKTMNTHKLILNLVLKEALKNDLISKNPCEFLRLPKHQRKATEFYTINQLNALFNAIKEEDLYSLIYITVIYGLRKSEALGLKWDSIDFENGLVTIKHTVVKCNIVVEKDTTKTSSSYRSYPLTNDVKVIFLRLKEQEDENRKLFGKEYIENDYVFKWADGHTYAPDFVSRKFSKLLKMYNLPLIRFHDLRHSCASLLIANGFSLKDIQEWLGHADFRTTANIYAHLDTERKQNIAESMSATFNV